MIRVLRIINRFNLGGPTYNATFLSAFLSDDFETKFIGGSHDDHEGNSVFIPEKYGVEYEIIPELQRSVNWVNDRKALKRVRAIIREFKPDIVHTHASKAGAIGRMAAYKEKVPVIVHTFHGHVFHSYFGKIRTEIYKNIERKLAGKTDAIIAISPMQKKELSEVYRIAESDKFSVIPLGFDLDKFRTDARQKRQRFRNDYQLDDTTIAIGIIGRLTAIKNHKWFFEVIQKVVMDSTKRIRVFVIGDGELMGDLRQEAMKIEAQVGRNVFVFTSWIKNIDEILPGLDIVALSSLNEGTPVSLIEAQAAGVPVISTNVGGVKDVVNNGVTGYVVDSFIPEVYQKWLSELIENEDLRQKMSQNGWNHVKEKYHYMRLCAEVEELYWELLKKKNLK